MAVIVKTYTFLDKITVDASEVNANFDTLKNEINGSLNSENVSANFSLAASQVSFADSRSFFSALSPEEALQQPSRLERGLHTVFVYPNGTNAFILYPGSIEIGGKIGTISTALCASGLPFIDCSGDRERYFVVCQPPADGAEITASDLGLYQVTAITITATDTSLLGGYYAGSRRVIGACYMDGSSCQNARNYHNPDPPQGNFSRHFSVAHPIEGLFDFSCVLDAFDDMYINDMTVFYDRDVGAYGARMVIHTRDSEADPVYQLIRMGSWVSYEWHYDYPTGSTYFNCSTALSFHLGPYMQVQVTEALQGGFYTVVVRPTVGSWENR